MVLNEYGLNFIEIPFSGSDRFIKEFNLNNQEVKNSDNIIPDIEYHNLSIVKNPYYRACYFYRNGSKIRKDRKLKQQSFASYFENNLNKWDFVDDDVIKSQFSYLEDVENPIIFKHEDLIEDWNSLNKILTELGLSSIQVYNEIDNIKDWEKYYEDQIAIEIVEYIFESDFENLGYSKL